MRAPYYQDEHVILYHGDCLEVLPRLGPVDLVVTSPPYNKGRQSGDYANMRGGYKSYSDDIPDSEYIDWQRDVIALLWDATAPAGAIFYNHKTQLRDGVAELPTRYIPDHVLLRQMIIWNRKGGFNWNASHFCPQHELILLLAHREFRLTSRSHSAAGDVWNLGIDSRDTGGHPCAFPESLPATAINATDARTVLDPFAGSGSTLRAAKNLGRKAIGIEIDESYCEFIATRLAQGVLDFGEVS